MNRQNRGKLSLSEYERALKRMAERGEMDLPLDDELAEIILTELAPVELTQDERDKLSSELLQSLTR